MKVLPFTQEQEQLHDGLTRHSNFITSIGSLPLEAMAIKIGTPVYEGAVNLMDEVRFMGTYAIERLLGPKPPTTNRPALVDALRAERETPLSQQPQLPPSGTVRVIGPKQQN
jgi:hypothetical protein